MFGIAEATNDDGSVIVGQSESDLSFEPFRWTSAGGIAPLRTLAGGAVSGSALDVTGDGKTVVGYAYSTPPIPNHSAGPKPAALSNSRRRQGLGVVSLTPLRATVRLSLVPFRGRRTQTRLHIFGLPRKACGDLQSVLVNDYGLDLTGWTLNAGSDISSDGSVLVGWGINPRGEAEGWRVTLPIPEPQSFSLTLFWVFAAIVNRGRHRRK